ncbi:MAG TPA: hypothetical protein VFK05_13420 [Polyangiaceae bacterium]|nr:hypothetical protein [Polyangiaceae bacterium]
MALLNLTLDPRAGAILADTLEAAEARELLSVREALCARIRERRTSLRNALQLAGISLAEELAQALASTVQLFLEVSERRVGNLHSLRTLSRALDRSPFVVATAVSADLSHAQRHHLRLQAQRLQALSQALSEVDARLAGFQPHSPQVANR